MNLPIFPFYPAFNQTYPSKAEMSLIYEQPCETVSNVRVCTHLSCQWAIANNS